MLSALVVSSAAWANSDQAAGQSASNSGLYTDNSTSSSMDSSNTTTGSQSSGIVEQSPGTLDEPGMTTRAESHEVTRGYLSNEVVGIKPQAGVLAYTQSTGDMSARPTIGFTAEANLASRMAGNASNVYVGPVTGFLYSHLGEPSSNFWGTTGSADVKTGAAGANMFLIPANLKVGYNVTDKVRLSAHGGGNVFYRSIASEMPSGSSTAASGSQWKFYPNAGGDLEVAVSPRVAILARPDWTFTPGPNFFTGTLGVGINIG